MVAMCGAVLFGACGGDSNSGDDNATPTTVADKPVAGGEIVVRQIQDVTSLDPLSGNSGFDQQSLYPFYDRLVNLEPETLEPKPGLATAWTFENPTTLVLKIRQGVKFHDGTALDAEAVRFNLDRAITLPTSTVKQDVSMIKTVEVRSPTEVQVNLNKPDSSLPIILSDRAGMMVSPTAAKDAAALGKHPVGAGAFTFVEWLPGDRLVGTKNPNYWQTGKPYLDKITFRFITAPDTARSALQAGELNVALQMQPTDVDPLKTNSAIKVDVHPSLFLDHCYFNFSKPPFNSKEARLAVNYAIDRKAVNDALTFGLGKPAAQAFPVGYWAYQKALDNAFPFDPTKAKEMLAKAGMPNGFEIKGVTTTASNFARLNEIVQAQLASVGIKMTFEQMPPAAATTAFFTKLEPHIYCSAWSGRPDASQTARSLFGVPSFFNAGAYDAPGMATALNAASGGADIKSRATAFRDVISISQSEALHVPLLFVPNVDAYSTKVKGFVPTLGKPDVSFVWLGK